MSTMFPVFFLYAVADPHMAPDHFFTVPFDIDNDNFGSSTSKFQHFMQVLCTCMLLTVCHVSKHDMSYNLL